MGYLTKELTLSEAKKQWATAEIQYAKRQKTYFAKYFSIK
jgi:tRNA A37 N6-isopentenylltransferase MiaA